MIRIRLIAKYPERIGKKGISPYPAAVRPTQNPVIYVFLTRLGGSKIVFTVPDLEVIEESLENNRRLCIAKSSFFESYLGVGRNWPLARIAARQAIRRFLKKLSDEGTLFRYLSDKGYEFTIWGSANQDLYNLEIRVI